MNTIRVSKGLDHYEDIDSDGPDLGPNCLQRLSEIVSECDQEITRRTGRTTQPSQDTRKTK